MGEHRDVKASSQAHRLTTVTGPYSNCYPHLKNILEQQAAVDGALGSRGRVSFPADTAARYRRSLPGQR